MCVLHRQDHQGPNPAWTLASVSQAIAEGTMSCTELMAACIARAEATQPSIHSLLGFDPRRSAAEACKLDHELAEGNYRGPLHGIPIAVKDVIDAEGYATTAGSKLLASNIAGRDAEIVAALRRLGAVVMGKANTHEFAFGATTPPTRNPWNPDHIAGGSSGGSAAAVAAGVSVVAVGTDTGGSVGVPAALCGVASLRPRRRTDIGMGGIIPLAPEFDQWGLMAGNAADLGLIWSSLTATTLTTGEPPQIIIPTTLKDTLPDTESQVEAAFFAAVERAYRAGYEILRKPIPDVREWHGPRMRVQLRQVLEFHRVRGWWPSAGALYSDETRANLELAERDEYRSLVPERARLAELDAMIDAHFGPPAVIVLPTTPVIAPRAADVSTMVSSPGERHPIVRLLGQATLPFARPCLTCMSVCCGFSGEGAPVGAQLVASDEAHLFAVAPLFEMRVS